MKHPGPVKRYRVLRDVSVWRFTTPITGQYVRGGELVKSIREVVYTEAELIHVEWGFYFFRLPSEAAPFTQFCVGKDCVVCEPCE